MEAEKNKAGNMNSVLRQALERRQTEHLSSNFSYRMMERVRLEAERQRKRRVRIGWMALLTSVFSLLGFGIYFLFFYLNINFIDYLPQRCTTRFFFVKVLCLHCFTGINLIGNR